MSGNDRQNQVFTSTSWAVYQHGFARQSASVRTGRNPHAKSPSPPSECGQTSVAGSDTMVRPMRPPSAPENPSPATDLSPSTRPYAPFFATPQIRNLPQCGHTFVAGSDTTVRPMRPVSATKNFDTAMILAASATNALFGAPFPQIRNLPQCDRTFLAGSDTTVRPVRPRPPRLHAWPSSRPCAISALSTSPRAYNLPNPSSSQPVLRSKPWSRK